MQIITNANSWQISAAISYEKEHKIRTHSTMQIAQIIIVIIIIIVGFFLIILSSTKTESKLRSTAE